MQGLMASSLSTVNPFLNQQFDEEKAIRVFFSGDSEDSE